MKGIFVPAGRSWLVISDDGLEQRGNINTAALVNNNNNYYYYYNERHIAFLLQRLSVTV